MPEPTTYTPRRTVRMSDELWEELESLRRADGFRSRAAWLEVMVYKEREKRQKREQANRERRERRKGK